MPHELQHEYTTFMVSLEESAYNWDVFCSAIEKKSGKNLDTRRTGDFRMNENILVTVLLVHQATGLMIRKRAVLTSKTPDKKRAFTRSLIRRLISMNDLPSEALVS